MAVGRAVVEVAVGSGSQGCGVLLTGPSLPVALEGGGDLGLGQTCCGGRLRGSKRARRGATERAVENNQLGTGYDGVTNRSSFFD